MNFREIKSLNHIDHIATSAPTMQWANRSDRPAAGFGVLTTGEAKRLKDAEAEDAFARERVERAGRPARDKGNAR